MSRTLRCIQNGDTVTGEATVQLARLAAWLGRILFDSCFRSITELLAHCTEVSG